MPDAKKFLLLICLLWPFTSYAAVDSEPKHLFVAVSDRPLTWQSNFSYSGDASFKVYFFDLANKNVSIKEIKIQNQYVRDVQYNDRTETIIFLTEGEDAYGGKCLNEDGTCNDRIYRIRNDEKTPTILLQSSSIERFFVDTKNGNIFVNDDDGIIRIIDFQTEKEEKRIGGITPLLLSQDKRYLLQMIWKDQEKKGLLSTRWFEKIDISDWKKESWQISDIPTEVESVSPDGAMVAFYSRPVYKVQNFLNSVSSIFLLSKIFEKTQVVLRKELCQIYTIIKREFPYQFGISMLENIKKTFSEPVLYIYDTQNEKLSCIIYPGTITNMTLLWSGDSKKLAYISNNRLRYYSVEEGISQNLPDYVFSNIQNTTPLLWAPSQNMIIYKDKSSLKIYNFKPESDIDIYDSGIELNEQKVPISLQFY